MIRILVLVGLEFKRISRSRPSLLVAILIPVLGIAAYALTRETRTGTAVRCFFPVAALALGVVLFYVRGIVDRASGLTFGLESTPAGGAILLLAKLSSCTLLAAVQTVVFLVAMRIVG